MPNIVEYKEEINLRETFTIRQFKFAKDPLSWEERLLLRRIGTRLQALIDRAIVSLGAEDRQFVEVCTKNGEPTTTRERLWLKYHAALAEEKRLEAKWLEEKKKSAEYEEYLKSRF